MSSTPGLVAQRHWRIGHTLTEMLVALAILGVMAGAVAPSLLDAGKQDAVSGASRALVDLLRRSRAAAAERGSVVTVVIDPASGRAWVSGDEDGPLTEDTQTGSLGERLAEARRAGAAVAIAATESRPRWVFTPAGLAFGEPVVVHDATHGVQVSVDRWTGEVHAQPR